MIGGGWWLIWCVLATVGTPLLAVGGVLRLYELHWQKGAGRTGARWLLGIGSVLCVPLVVYLLPTLYDALTRSPQ